MLKYRPILFFAIFIAEFCQVGCAKEFSFEGSDTTHLIDSLIKPEQVPTASFGGCSLCKPGAPLALNTWDFSINDIYFCGGTTNQGFIGTNNSDNKKTTFTFFGPSFCSNDSGLVMTVYLPLPFDIDRADVDATLVAFYYYDHQSTQNLYISRKESFFHLQVHSYIASTNIATGTFGGVVYKANNDSVLVKNGRFRIELK